MLGLRVDGRYIEPISGMALREDMIHSHAKPEKQDADFLFFATWQMCKKLGIEAAFVGAMASVVDNVVSMFQEVAKTAVHAKPTG
jgi:hypothetical protein